MCGIFGHIGNIQRELAARCTDALVHRGPDGGGLWIGDAIALGHRRLAILDLSDLGTQPMSYANGRYWITFNGEIYNFLELRSQLENLGHRFRSESDTEVILAAFQEWGEKCLSKFNGMWAFSIWDNLENRLFMSRDRFGKKPLFYASVKSGFAFASEMKALFPLLGDVRPNTRIVKDIKLIFHYESTDQCVVEGIKRFPAGHYGWLKDSSLELHRYWCTLDCLVDVPANYGDQVEQFHELFVDSCRIRMRSDVPIGTALSGGLDSSSTISTVAHIARQEHGNRLSRVWQNAFVASFPGTPLDETAYAKQVTDFLDINATLVDIDPIQGLSRLSEYIYLFEDIYITPPIPFMQTYEAMRSGGVKVTLDGHGADECYAGYSFDYPFALLDTKFSLNKIQMILDTRYESYPQHTSQFRLPSKARFFAEWYVSYLKKYIFNRKADLSGDVNHVNWTRLDNLGKKLYQSTHETILPTLLRNYDRYSMANGVEIRMPFMDHRLVSYAFSLPWTSKIRSGFSKSIIRDALSRYMPKEIAYRKSKIGFNSPIVDWIKGPLKLFIQDTIHSESFKSCHLIDAVRVADCMNKIINMSVDDYSLAEKNWSEFYVYLWETVFIKHRSIS